MVATLGCSDDVGLPDARQAIDAALPGQVDVTWTIGHQGAPVTCSQISGASVTVEIVKVGAAFGVVDSFSCASGMGRTRTLAPGAYDITLSLDGSGGTLAGPIVRAGVVVVSNQAVAADTVAFDVDPSGTLAFRIATGTADSCAAQPGGAGITATRIELRDAAGTCVPTTSGIGAGAVQPAGTYASDCGATTYACIAADQDVTATAVSSGQHSMAITGLVGATACWNRTSSFVVRAAGLTTTLSSQLLIRNTTLCPVN